MFSTVLVIKFLFLNNFVSFKNTRGSLNSILLFVIDETRFVLSVNFLTNFVFPRL